MTILALKSRCSLGLAIALTILLPGCGEVTSVEYADRDDALSKNAIGESKWLPVWLPSDALEIQETHDVDTNESWAVFRVASGRLELPADCELKRRPPMTSERVMRRFPRFARDAWSRASEYDGDIYRCPDRGAARWVLHDRESELVYSWVKFL
jgi:hypothetical protein